MKFRFQVSESDYHDYGETSWQDVLFETDTNNFGKYGGFVFYEKLGGIQEYFGLSEVICANGNAGKPPTKEP